MREPKLKRFDQAYLDAFFSLSHSRQSAGMGGPSPILVSEILAYLALEGIDSRDERLKYLRIVQLLDSVFLNDAADKIKQQTKNNKRPQ